MPNARKPIEDESILHIIQRGNNKQTLFKKDEDFDRFLKIMLKYLKRFKFKIYHYCLMKNHLHIILKITQTKKLAKFMQGVLQSYRFYYKKEYDYIGHVFQGRFISKVIDKDSYLLECGRYVERNPVRSSLVSKPEDYPWSSYRYYALNYKDSIITQNPLYLEFGKTSRKRQAAYSKYVSETRPYDRVLERSF